jgi:UDP-N-acetyl-D-glucosamine dehydrogenase
MKNQINFKNQLLKKIKNKTCKVGIIGLGYVGLQLAMIYAKKNFEVLGFDNDKNKIKNLKKFISPIGTLEVKKIKEYLKKKNYFYSNFKKIILCDVIIICVPTPLKKNLDPDLSYIHSSFKSILPLLKEGQALVLESTTYPGTVKEVLIPKLPSHFKIGSNFFIGFSSERIDPGVNDNKIAYIPKVVSGSSVNCLRVIDSFYKAVFLKTVKAQNIETAEFSKLMENIYRSVNIAFVNEMKMISDKLDIDIFEIIKVANSKPYGFRRFWPGPGVGGHCIPIDPYYLSWKAKQLGTSSNFVELSSNTNFKVINFIYNKISLIKNKFYKNKKNFHILILGLSYKKNIDDIRESASLKIIKKLKKNKNNKIFYHDPHVDNQNCKLKFGNHVKNLTKLNLKKYDLTILLTDHDCFQYKKIYKYSKKILDCRGKYRVDKKVFRG